ncbi:uncharacterized protein [Aegilops tauschii subsp. strangulata]|uniref:DUF6598 domain-containing protein n=3 Tax=Aegilops tauschii TaxID=37682 RepID=A0A453CSF9_AEGTS|nr:uncharacterized protein LOC120974669 [Aegilops tauschii subsp. strangulata]
MGGAAESGSSSTRTADRTVIRTGPVPPLPGVPSRKRILDGSHRPDGGVTIKPLLVDSKHRDGSILRESCWWHKMYRVNITDETSVEPMMMSKKPNCQPYSWDCQMHGYCNMMQIYWLKLAYISVDSFDGPVQVYGFLAARDILNPRRNYLFNRGRDDPLEIVQDDDWLIQMSSPKRGIEMTSSVLVEFDMRIKIGEKEEDDLQLIDGAVSFSDMDPPINMAFTRRLCGEGGAVDINLAHMYEAAEATIQVRISEACGSGLSLCLTASGSALQQQARLFDGIVGETPCDLGKFVFAVMSLTKLVVLLKVGRGGGSDCVYRFHLFDVQKHGDSTVSFEIPDMVTIEVKVTWSTLDIPDSALEEDNRYNWRKELRSDDDDDDDDYEYDWNDY